MSGPDHRVSKIPQGMETFFFSSPSRVWLLLRLLLLSLPFGPPVLFSTNIPCAFRYSQQQLSRYFGSHRQAGSAYNLVESFNVKDTRIWISKRTISSSTPREHPRGGSSGTITTSTLLANPMESHDSSNPPYHYYDILYYSILFGNFLYWSCPDLRRKGDDSSIFAVLKKNTPFSRMYVWIDPWGFVQSYNIFNEWCCFLS